jgi:hypothetical protein
MNNRIHELARRAEEIADEKSGAAVDDTGGWTVIWNQLFDEAFAELIIRDCMAICIHNGLTAQYSATPAKARAANAMAKSCANLMAGSFGITPDEPIVE